MNAKERRKNIVDILNSLAYPVKGEELAKEFSVSRQIIVQDIAIIRAQGDEIIATPNGYLINKYKMHEMVLHCKNHENKKEMYEELKIIIELGAIIYNVSVEHPIYGNLEAKLDIKSMKELDDFMDKVENKEFKQLSTLTEYEHTHLIKANNKDVFGKIIQELKNKEIIVDK